MVDANSDAVKLSDLHRALIHEHGHMAVAAHFGILGHIRISENPNGGLEKVHFTGRFYQLMPDTSAAVARAIGLAGTLAEMLLDDFEIDVASALDDLECNESFSYSDRKHSDGYGFDDVAETVELLRRLWPRIAESVARDYRTEACSMVTGKGPRATLATLYDLYSSDPQPTGATVAPCPDEPPTNRLRAATAVPGPSVAGSQENASSHP